VYPGINENLKQNNFDVLTFGKEALCGTQKLSVDKNKNDMIFSSCHQNCFILSFIG